MTSAEADDRMPGQAPPTNPSAFQASRGHAPAGGGLLSRRQILYIHRHSHADAVGIEVDRHDRAAPLRAVRQLAADFDENCRLVEQMDVLVSAQLLPVAKADERMQSFPVQFLGQDRPESHGSGAFLHKVFMARRKRGCSQDLALTIIDAIIRKITDPTLFCPSRGPHACYPTISAWDTREDQ